MTGSDLPPKASDIGYGQFELLRGELVLIPQYAQELVRRLVTRDATRTEADIQADIQGLLTGGGLSLEPGQVVRLEVPTADGTRRRLDVEVGHCVIEVKKDLRSPTIRRDAQTQLAGYVVDRSRLHGRRYVGVLTDGVEWVLYDLRDDALVEVASLTLVSADAERLLTWLETILATESAVKPTPEQIQQRLGVASPGHLLDHAELTAFYAKGSAIPEVALKRQLWARLLRTAFGSAFRDDSDTFLDHTLLVITAEIIAHAVIGVDISGTGTVTPADILSGRTFKDSGIGGVVEADFFDWVLKLDGGAGFVSTLAERLSRFDWSAVEHDVLKHLYESVITAENRAALGEYYTPDWLADRAVYASVEDPLNQRVLDPSCGSGTFVFHAARAYLAAADATGVDPDAAVEGLTAHVIGMDIHPVAVTLARVTYLLAIGSERLTSANRPALSVPVYLGDSLQWEQNRNLFHNDDTFTISTMSDELTGDGGGGALFGDDLVFPRTVLADASRFDALVSDMADRAQDVTGKADSTLAKGIMTRNKVAEADRAELSQTFAVMRGLAKSKRNHIWGYYVRNLIRPIWLSEPANKVDVLVGNPPWLRYSKMTKAMQKRYLDLAEPRQLLSGPLGAAGRDLSTLFVTRAVELYLKPMGAFAFVMPHGTMTRLPHTGFRSGRWSPHTAQTGDLNVEFITPWDLSKAPTGFPMVSCLIRGIHTTSLGVKMPTNVDLWSARLPDPNVTWAEAKELFTISPGAVVARDSGLVMAESPYKTRFRQGALFVPRVLVNVEDAPTQGLGAGAGRRRVRSKRSRDEKAPWKTVDSIEETVERQFVRTMHLGRTLLPFRMMTPDLVVVPVTDNAIMTTDEIEGELLLPKWWAQVEKRWDDNKGGSSTTSFLERLDYHQQLSAQLPTHPVRVVYSASGNTLAAGIVTDTAALIEHKLYWAPVDSIDEGRYLTAILNSPALLSRVTPLQALGLFGARDFDKTVFAVPFGKYAATNPDHVLAASLALRAETVAGGVPVTDNFKEDRASVRAALVADGVAAALHEVIERILPAVAIE